MHGPASHDLLARAFSRSGWVVAYPSPTQIGATSGSAVIRSQSTITRTTEKIALEQRRAEQRSAIVYGVRKDFFSIFWRGAQATLPFSLLNSDVRCARSSLFQRAMTPAFARKAEQSRCTSPRFLRAWAFQKLSCDLSALAKSISSLIFLVFERRVISFQNIPGNQVAP
jgi:hypothetical protein